MAKAYAASTRLLDPEPFAMRCIMRVDRIRYLLHGGILLDSSGHKRVLGAALADLRDTRPGKQHLPHPLRAAFTSYSLRAPVDDSKQFLQCGSWRPARFRYKQWASGVRNGELDDSPLSEGEMTMLQAALTSDFPESKVQLSSLQLTHPTALVSGERRLHVEDDCSYSLAGSNEFMRIAKVVCLGWDNRSVLYVFPQHYIRVGISKDLGVPMVTRRALDRVHFNQPVLAERIREQVMVVHACRRICSKRQPHACSADACSTVCGPRLLCAEHGLPACKHDACAKAPSTRVQRECHASSNVDFFVFERQHGFIVEGREADVED